MANNFKDFLVAEMRDAGMGDDQVVAAIDKIAANDKISGKLNGILKTATEDYNAQVGRVNTLTQDNKYLREQWYPEAKTNYDRMQTEYNAALAELQQLRNGGAPPAFDASKYLTKDDLERNTEATARRFAGLLKDATNIASRHSLNYKEALNMQELDELAVRMAQERGLPAGAVPLTDAYDKYIEPRKKAADDESRKNWEKETRAQIERDLRSQNNLPANPAPVEQSQMFRPTPKENIPQDLESELLATWNGAVK